MKIAGLETFCLDYQMPYPLTYARGEYQAREAVLHHLGAIPCALSEIIVKGLASPDLAMEVDVFAVQS